MLSFFGMRDDYQSRKVDRYEKHGLIVSTARVNDGEMTYETAISHPDYKGGDFIIVGKYNTVDDALNGHNKWVNVMTSDKLPEYLENCNNSEISRLAEEMGLPTRFYRNSAEPEEPVDEKTTL